MAMIICAMAVRCSTTTLPNGMRPRMGFHSTRNPGTSWFYQGLGCTYLGFYRHSILGFLLIMKPLWRVMPSLTYTRLAGARPAPPGSFQRVVGRPGQGTVGPHSRSTGIPMGWWWRRSRAVPAASTVFFVQRFDPTRRRLRAQTRRRPHALILIRAAVRQRLSSQQSLLVGRAE